MEIEDERDKALKSLNKYVKKLKSIMLMYKLSSAFSILITIILFAIDYYLRFPVEVYVFPGLSCLYVTYTSYIRLSELRLFKMEIEMIIYEFSRKR